MKMPNDEAGLLELRDSLLAAHTIRGQRAPGKARIDEIIAAGIELAKLHRTSDISIAMIAKEANITRTSVYAHFTSVTEIFENIALRFVEQTGNFVLRYVRDREPSSLRDVAVLIIRAVQAYFNVDENSSLANAQHVPFEARNLVKNYDKIAALSYYMLWEIDWVVDPLSEQDPFRKLVMLQSALFEHSINLHGCITDDYAEETIAMALSFIERAEARFSKSELVTTDAASNLRQAVERLIATGDDALLTVTVRQLEALLSLTSA